jgi:hypothetical protein
MCNPGKTILASSVIEQCRLQLNSTVVYFYCKHRDPSRDNFIGLAQSLIAQFLRLDNAFLPYVFQLQTASGTSTLRSSTTAKEILAAAVEVFNDLILVIDGLDECVKSQKNEIVSWVRSEVALVGSSHSRRLRCCFLSQEDKDTGKLFKGLPKLKITGEHNSEDIARYCRRRAKQIGEDFMLSSDAVKNLAECVSGKADGKTSKTLYDIIWAANSIQACFSMQN